MAKRLFLCRKFSKNLESDPAGFEALACWIEKDRKKAMRIVKLNKERLRTKSSHMVDNKRG
ncbi:MAG: hypothetical protein SWE60_06830 [Thermodesulfobacteriota bacterium]|nr:hypothetical protein [Thermodesulfobacteriota bacterium]